MVWHSEEVIGVDAAVEALNRLLPRLEQFQCIVIQPNERMKFTIVQKPWVGILLSGKLSPTEISQLEELGRRLGLLVSGSTPSEDGSKGLSFCSVAEDLNFGERCRHFLNLFCSSITKLSICCVKAQVREIPPNPQCDNQ